MRIHEQSIEALIMSFWYVIILATGVRTQQIVTELNLVPAVLNNLNPIAVATSNPVLAPAATFSPYSPYTPANSDAESDFQQEGLSTGTVIGIIIGCAIFLIGAILFYRWRNMSGQRKFSSGATFKITLENNQLLNSFEAIRNAALKSTESKPPINKMQGRRSAEPILRPVAKEKQSALLQPSLYTDENAILDSSIDLPILPANLSASERVRIIIDTLRKNRDYQSRPGTPVTIEKSEPFPNHLPALTQMSESNQNEPSRPSFLVPGSSFPESKVPQGYQPLKKHPKHDQIDIKVSNMIKNVLKD